MNEYQTAITEPTALTDAAEFEEIDGEEIYEPLSVKAAGIVRFLWSRRKTILIVTAVGIVLALLYAVTSPNIYTSSASLMPPDNSSPYSNVLSALSGSGAALTSATLGLETPAELFVAILQSRNVQDSLIARFDLANYYHARLMADARRGLAGDTNVSEDVKSGVIKVTVNSKSPTLAANLANGYVEELNRVVMGNSTSSARRERIFLEGRLKDVKKDLDESSKVLSQFSSKNRTLDVDTQAKSMVDQGLKLEAELIESRSELAALRQAYSEDNTRVKAAQARVAELERQINMMGGLSGNNSDPGKAGSTPYPTATELPTLGLTFADLQRKVRVDEELWAALTKQYEAAKVDEVKEIPTVLVLDAGAVPERKSAPTRWLIMVIGTLLSFCVGCLVAFGLEHWNAMDPQSEPKRLVLDVTGTLFRFRNRHA